MSETNGSQRIVMQAKPWIDNDNSVWLATTVGISRNLEKFEFPSKLSQERRKQIISLITRELNADDLFKQLNVHKAEDLTSIEKEYLSEHFVSTMIFQQTHAGEAFALDDTGQFMAVLNLNDHVHYVLLDIRGEIENTLNRLIKIESSVGKKLNYSFSPKFGFLTADPMDCGTALSITAFLQLPALVHTTKIDDTLEKYADENIVITGIQGNPTELIGDVIAIQNNYTVGLSEESIGSTMRNFTTKLLLEENSARSKIRGSQDGEIKDKVSRAYAILMHSYNIEAVESMNAISLIKLGLDMEWIKGVSVKDLNQVFFACRRAHLLSLFKEKVPQDQLTHKRADYIHKTLKNLQLAI